MTVIQRLMMTICFRSEESCCVCSSSSIDPTPIRAVIIPWVAPHSSTSASKTKRWSSLLLTCASTNFKVGWDLKWTKKKRKKNWRAAAHGPVLYRFCFFIFDLYLDLGNWRDVGWGYPSKTAVIRNGASDRGRKATKEQNTCGEMIEGSKR